MAAISELRSLRGVGWYLAILLALLYFVSFVDRLVLAVLIDPIKAELGVSDVQIGMLIGPAFSLFYAAMGLPLAWLIDRTSRKRIAIAGVVLWSLGTIGAGFAESFSMLIGTRLGVAIGEAVLSPVAMSLIADYFIREERGSPMGLFLAGGTLGSTFAYAIGGALFGLGSQGAFADLPLVGYLEPWRAVLVLVGLPGLLIAALVALTLREPVRGQCDGPLSDGLENGDEGGGGVFAGRRQAIWFYGCYFLANACIQIIIFAALTWYPAYLSRHLQFAPAQSGTLLTLPLGIGAFLILILPSLLDYLAKRGWPAAIVPMSLTLVSIGVTAFSASLLVDGVAAMTVLMTLGMACIAGSGGLPSIVVGLTAPPTFRARLMAINLSISNVIGLSLGPTLTAALAEHVYSGTRALGLSMVTLCAILGPIAVLLLLLSWRPLRDAFDGR